MYIDYIDVYDYDDFWSYYCDAMLTPLHDGDGTRQTASRQRRRDGRTHASS